MVASTICKVYSDIAEEEKEEKDLYQPYNPNLSLFVWLLTLWIQIFSWQFKEKSTSWTENTRRPPSSLRIPWPSMYRIDVIFWSQ